jgi:Bacterial Ig-like domain (group 3)/Invasin, domain 3
MRQCVEFAGERFLSLRMARRGLLIGAALAALLSSSLFPVRSDAAAKQVKIKVTLSPNTIVADGSSTSTAVAVVARGGFRITGDNVVFSASDSGVHFSATTEVPSGAYLATLTSSNTPGHVAVSATDTTIGNSAAAQLTQTSGGSTVPDSSKLSLVALPSAAVTNESVTLLAAVTSTQSTPSGTITFANGGIPITGCIAEPITPALPAATCETSFAAATSPEHLTAAFTPSAPSGATSLSGAATVTVDPESTSTSLDAATTAVVGASTTYSASVMTPANGSAQVEPTGSVEFLDGGQPIRSCLSQMLSHGGATCSIAYGMTGTHSISARYMGDGNFNGSTSSPRTVSIVAPSARARGMITSTMQWTFYYTPAYTKVLALVVNGVPTGATVRVGCQGGGCPFARHVATATNTNGCRAAGNHACGRHGTIDLTAAFWKRLLRVGTRISVHITRHGWTGKSYTFAMRARRGPLIRIACLAPGGTRPGLGC